MDDHDTRTKLLDAAEKVFAEKGFAAASLRAITSRAGVNLAAVNYHFGSKEELARAVIGRRLEPINRERMARFAAIREGGRPEMEEVLAAFVEPPFVAGRGRESRAALVAIMSRALAEPENVMQVHFFELMKPVWRELLELAAAARPDLDRDELFWRLNFVIGAMSHAMRCLDRLPPLEGFPAAGATDILARLMPFVTAGMKA